MSNTPTEVSINRHSNLLEKDPYNYELQDVKQPNLLREFFEYTEIPKVCFNFRRTPINMPEEIWITDTTFRDGQQSREPYTVEQIVDIYKMLNRLGGPKGLIRQTEFFAYSKRDREAIERCKELGYEFPEITTWIRAKAEDFKLVADLGIKETGILVSCSDYHIFNKLGMSRREAMNHYLSVINSAFEAGVVPRCHLEDITRSDFYGFVVPFVNAIHKLSVEANMPVKFRACDTLGYGVPYNGVAMPRSVPGILYGLQHYAELPSEMLEWHGHNDFYKAVPNAASAWLYGASAVNTTVFGIGERTGNVPLEAMVFEYAQLRGTLDGMDTTVITELKDYYEKKIGYKIPEHMPFVGENFNVTRAGIHADGLLKDEEIYNIFDTDKFLNRPPLVAINQNSGNAGIAVYINNKYGLKDGRKVSKTSPLVKYIKDWVDKEYEDGRVSGIGSEEINLLVNSFFETYTGE